MAGAPARAVCLALIRIYQVTLSGALGGRCRFFPSCSHYAADALRIHGLCKGVALAAWRVGRCNPFGRGGFDPVPPPGSLAESDGVIRSPEGAGV